MMFKPRAKGSPIKNLLKLKDGEVFVGVFRGEPHTFYQHWNNGRSVVCTRTTGTCEPCNAGEYGSFRFRVNLVSRDEQSTGWKARVFEGSGKVYDMLTALGTEYDLAETKVKISRNGSDLATTYSIVPTKDFQIPAETLAEIDRVALNKLDVDADPSLDDIE